MRISTSKETPAVPTLIGLLKQEFSGKYAYELFGFGKDKTVIVKKSLFTGVQISKTETGLNVEGVFPSSESRLLLFFDSLFTGFAGGAFSRLFFGSSHRNFEQEVASFLVRKFN